MNAETVLPCHQRGALVGCTVAVNNGQGRIGQQGVFSDLEGVSTEASENLVVEVAPLIGDGHGVPDIAVNIAWDGELAGDRIARLNARFNLVKNQLPAVRSDGGDVVFVNTEGFTVVTPNRIGFVGLLLIKPLKAHEVH